MMGAMQIDFSKVEKVVFNGQEIERPISSCG